MVSRKPMMSAGTARRRAGSAVSKRRYAGLAIDCANPLIESERIDARAVSARAILAPARIAPAALDRKDVPHLSESPPIGIEKRRFVESLRLNFEDSPNSFLDSVTKLRRWQAPSPRVRLCSPGVSLPRVCTPSRSSAFRQGPLHD